MCEYYLGIDIGGTYIRLGKVDSSGSLTQSQKYERSILGGKNTCGESFCQLIEKFAGGRKPIAICGALASIMNRECTRTYGGPNLCEFDGIDIIEILKARFDVPVFLEKDTNALLYYDIAEKNLDPSDTIVGFYVGTGIGNSIFIGGDIHRGSNGISGELGHIPIYGKTRPCSCGSIGCAELYAGGKRLIEIKDKYLPGGRIEDVFTRLLGKPEIKEFIDVMACVFAAEINIIDPDCAILGGGVIMMEGFPKELLENELLKRTRKINGKTNLKILYSDCSNFSGAQGAVISAKMQMNNMNNREDTYEI